MIAALRSGRFQPEVDNENEEEPVLDVQSAVLYDTLLVLAEAVKLLNFHSFLGPTDVSCLREKSWESGSTFYNYINSVETEGITGKIRFQVSLAGTKIAIGNHSETDDMRDTLVIISDRCPYEK